MRLNHNYKLNNSKQKMFLKNTRNKFDVEILRLKAEELQKKQGVKSGTQLSETDILKLIHELEVHQIELEMQNCELNQANEQVKVAAKKYTELYEFAPIGYFTLSKEGEILELNHCGAEMLDKKRQRLKNSRIGFFISDDNKPIFNLFLAKIFNSKAKETCEVTLSRDGNSPMYVKLQGIVTKNEEQCLLIAVDITDRKRSEESLRENDRLLMESQRVARLGNFIWDIASGLWTSSNILNDIFGIDETYTRSLEGWAALIYPDWRETMNVYVVNEVLGKHQRFDKEYKIINQRSGKEIWVHGLAELEIDENNQPIKLIGTITDITERKLAEEALKNSKSLMDAAFESVHNGILVVSEQGAVIKTNAKFAQLWNIPGDLLSSADDKVLLDYVIDQLEDPVEFITKISELYEEPELESFDLIYFKDGRIFERISKPMHLESKPKGRVWSFLDITDQKQAEIALMKSEEKYRSLTEKIGEGVCFVDEKEIFIYANFAADKLFGVHKSGLIGLCLNDFLLGENIEIIKRETQKRSKGKTSSFEHEIILKDGSKKDILVTATPSFIDKKFTGTFCILRDITDRKRYEAEIKIKNEHLIQANAEKDKLFSFIAHDLRSPFQSLLGFTQLMVEDLPTLTSDQTQKMALGMRTSATKLFNLLENLLEWSMMQRGIISSNPKSFVLLTGIVPIIELVRDTSDKKMIRIACNIPEDLRVSADAQMFKSLISNLVFNAVKYTPKGGSISIEAKPIPDGWVEISIKDSGIGMNKSIIDNLFRLDIQTNRRGTEGEPSSGLGLILCKDFVEKHGGKIWVESEEGKGSTFYFTLPVFK